MTFKIFLFILTIFLFFPFLTFGVTDILSNIRDLFLDLYSFAIKIAIALAILRISWGGFIYLLSVGEITKVQEAKEMIVDSILGLLVVLGTYTFLVWIGFF